MTVKKLRALIFSSSLILTIIFGALFGYFGYRFWNSERLVERHAMQIATDEAATAEEKINEKLSTLSAATEETAKKLSNGELSYNDILSYAKKVLTKHTRLFGITVAFKPNIYKKKSLHAIFVKRNEGANLITIQLDKLYNYTIPTAKNVDKINTDWYRLPLEQNKSMWMEPQVGKAAKRMVIDYVSPFYLPNKTHTKENQAGVVVYSASVDTVNRYITKMLLGNTSYGYVVAKNGIILSHPLSEKVGKRVKVMPGKAGKLRKYTDKSMGTAFWKFELPLKNLDWVIRINLDKQNFLQLPEIKLSQVSWMILTGLLTFLFLSLVLFRVDKGTTSRLWAASIASSILFIIAIIFLWYFHLLFMQPNVGTKITDQASLNKYLLLHGDINKSKPEIYIPTGILVTNIYFPSHNRVALSGYLWQRYPENLVSDKSVGFLFPQQAGLTSVRKISEENQGNKRLVIWHFDTNVRQALNPAAYPLDKESVSIPIVHKNIAENFVLVPDLDGYRSLNPQSLPGIDAHTILEDWIFQHSFFSYKLDTPNAYFGLDRTHIKQGVPELNFNIVIARNILNPLFSYLIPLLFVAFMLFAIVMSGKTTHIISYAGAMLIVITVTHVSLRESIAVQGISYMETFYLVLYPMIVAITVNFLLRAGIRRFQFLHFRDNLIPKLLYWPVILAVNFIVTLIMFGFV